MDGNELKKERIQHCMTQRQMADILGVERNHIYMMENGKRTISDRIERRFRAWLKASEEDSRVPPVASGVSEREPEEMPAWAEAIIDRLDALSKEMRVVQTTLLRLASAQLGRNPLEPEE